MSIDESSSQHLTPEDVFGYMEDTLARRRRRQVKEHLDECSDCVQYLATVLRSARPATPTSEEEEILNRMTKRSPEEVLRALRPQIIATSPGSSELRKRRTWNKLLPAAAAAAVLAILFVLIQTYAVAPARSRRIAAQAISDLVTLRQGAGRIPLRYIPGFSRGRVMRSGFDTVDPAEGTIEDRLRRAVSLAPGEVSSNLSLGLFLLDKGDLEGAENHLRKVLDLEPDSVMAANGLAVTRYEQALVRPARAPLLLREGLAMLREAQSVAPEDPQVAFNIAKFYQDLGAAPRARNAWMTYLRMDSGSEWAEVALENLEALQGR